MKYSILDTVSFPKDLAGLSIAQLQQLAHELRHFIIDIVASKEGHLGASLGVVELTIALHYVFNTPYDRLVWDVGHQAYGHKILTGRKDIFHTNRQFGGISGFPKITESDYDTFGTGHSSTSISAALGMAIASTLKGEDRQHIAIIGDASIASGMAFEGLNHAGVSNTNLLVILNDNSIGIDPSVGALKNYLTTVKKGIEDSHNIFEALNFSYTGPVDGHDLAEIISQLHRLKKEPGPKLLHLVTTKGKGLRQAEENQVKYHAPGKFNAVTGDLSATPETEQPSKFQDVFGITLLELAEQNEKIVAITPAMPTGSSLTFMMEKFPERALDVGIAEQHALTLAAGLATHKLTVFCVVYSTFLQRAYDQLIHDIALQNLPVILCIDRAGLVGEDGATHHGVFDISFLRCIPNLIIASPRDEIELRNLMFTAQTGLANPIAIRYPRGRGHLLDWKMDFKTIPIGTADVLQEGTTLCILSLGRMTTVAEKIIESHAKKNAIGLIDMRFVKPLDEKVLVEAFGKYKKFITLEDGAITGGFGSAILEFANKHNFSQRIEMMGVPDEFIEHGKVEELEVYAGYSRKQIQLKIEELLS